MQISASIHGGFGMRSPAKAACLLLWVSVTCVSSAAPPERYAAIIDRHIQQRWHDERVQPAAEASDAEFLRRAWLDVAGRIPPVGEARSFLEDADPDKRRRLIAKLLDSSLHVERFADQWLARLVPEATADYQLAYVAEELRSWLRQQALANTPCDELVREILRVPLRGGGNRGAMAFYSNASEPRPTAFFAAKEVAPENLAAATARQFLGIRVDCAQCHDHPFADWRREQFWSYAAFFQGLATQGRGNFLTDLFAQGARGDVRIRIPETEIEVEAKFLNGQSPQLDGRHPRHVVAAWITGRDNPYFARAMVNRAWADLLGRGLVDPVDDMDETNPPSHPELLEELAVAFAEDFDLRALTAGIMLSAPYQRSGVRTHSTQEDPAMFARFLARRLDSRQVHDSLVEAIAMPRQPFSSGLAFDANGVEYRQYFSSAETPLERVSSVQQILLVMNGQMVQQGTTPQARVIQGLIDAPGLQPEDRVDSLYLLALSRMPSDEERQRALDYVAREDQEAAGLSDLLWSLINSAEFIVNH